MFGGGAGGGRLIAGILLLGEMAFGGINCAPWPLSTGMLGLSRRAATGAGAAEARLPGTKEGVLETTRRDERKGAGSERTCTDVGLRSGAADGGGEVWKETLLREGDDVRSAADGGLAGAVTERLITMPRGRGAGPDGVRDDMRRGTTIDPSAFCVCGRTGNGRMKGFGVSEVRRWE